jgi:hypothetical protein
VFLSEPGTGPRFRFTYDWSGGGALKIIFFEIAPPTAQDTFSKYLEATVMRRR